MNSFIVPFVAYLLGSIPFGLILTRIAGVGDLRNIGSGNIGATNVLRTGKKWLAALTLLMDFAKGYLAVTIAVYMEVSELEVYFAAFTVVIGHIYPIWLKGKGGKGVATALGTILALDQFIFALAIGLWLAVFVIFKISSLSAITMFGVVPIAAFLMGHRITAAYLMVIALIVIYRHKSNIKRLLRGEEKPFERAKK